MEILNKLNPSNTVSVNRPLAHAIGLAGALMYSALISKQEYYAARGMLDGDGCFYSTVADLQESTTLSKRQQHTAIEKLVSAGLIECFRRGMPSRRYFRVLDEAALLEELLARGEELMTGLNPIAQGGGNSPAGGNRNDPPEVAECARKQEQNEPYTYNPKEKNLNKINHNPSIVHDETEAKDDQPDFSLADERSDYQEIIRGNINYGQYGKNQKVDELVDIMTDVLCTRKSTVRVNREELPKDVVRSRFLKLEQEHIDYVLTSLSRNTSAVRNIRAYLITALYNSATTINSYYSSLVRHDMYGGVTAVSPR